MVQNCILLIITIRNYKFTNKSVDLYSHEVSEHLIAILVFLYKIVANLVLYIINK